MIIRLHFITVGIVALHIKYTCFRERVGGKRELLISFPVLAQCLYCKTLHYAVGLWLGTGRSFHTARTSAKSRHMHTCTCTNTWACVGVSVWFTHMNNRRPTKSHLNGLGTLYKIPGIFPLRSWNLRFFCSPSFKRPGKRTLSLSLLTLPSLYTDHSARFNYLVRAEGKRHAPVSFSTLYIRQWGSKQSCWRSIYSKNKNISFPPRDENLYAPSRRLLSFLRIRVSALYTFLLRMSQGTLFLLLMYVCLFRIMFISLNVQ